jgi:hypothetical protein
MRSMISATLRLMVAGSRMECWRDKGTHKHMEHQLITHNHTGTLCSCCTLRPCAEQDFAGISPRNSATHAA